MSFICNKTTTTAPKTDCLKEFDLMMYTSPAIVTHDFVCVQIVG